MSHFAPFAKPDSASKHGTGSGQFRFAGLVGLCSTPSVLGWKGAALATMRRGTVHRQPMAHGLGQSSIWEDRSEPRREGQQGWGRHRSSAQTSLVQQLLAEV